MSKILPNMKFFAHLWDNVTWNWNSFSTCTGTAETAFFARRLLQISIPCSLLPAVFTTGKLHWQICFKRVIKHSGEKHENSLKYVLGGTANTSQHSGLGLLNKWTTKQCFIFSLLDTESQIREIHQDHLFLLGSWVFCCFLSIKNTKYNTDTALSQLSISRYPLYN